MGVSFSWIHAMDSKLASDADYHQASLIAIAARVHYEAERIEIPVAIRVPHNSEVTSIFSHMVAMEKKLSQLEDRLKRLEIYEKYNESGQDILYKICNNKSIGDEASRTKDFLFMRQFPNEARL